MDYISQIRDFLREYENLKAELSRRTKFDELEVSFPNFEYFSRSELEQIESSLYKELLELRKKYNSIKEDNSKQVNLIGARLTELEPIIMDGITKIINYDGFDIDWIGKVLSDVASVYLGEKYEYLVVEVPTFPKGSVSILTNNPKKQYTIEELQNSSDDKIVNFGTLEKISFYRLKQGALLGYSCLEKFKIHCSPIKWDFLYEFVNMLISFRIEHNKIEITDEELNQIKEDFYHRNIEKIKINYWSADEAAKYKIKKQKEEILCFEEGVAYRKEQLEQLNKKIKQKKLGTIDNK